MADEHKVTVLGTLWPMGGVLSGALLIAWATEVLSFFLSRGLAFAVLALLQVLPEFAVEAVITSKAALDPNQLYLVTANFTGANRLIVGLFVPLVFFMASRSARKRGQRISFVEMPQESSIEVVALIIATLYSILFVIRGSLGILDAVFLVALYVAYLVLVYRLPPEEDDEGELPLVPRTIRGYSTFRQKWIIAALFVLGGALLFLSVEPFYENTLALGAAIGVGEYFLFQWIAPLLSEFPELITIAYWGRTGRAQLGLTNAISSKVNQWTLLIAMIPVVYLFGTWQNGNAIWNVPFDDAQRLEVLLTAAQGLFAAACFMNLRLHRWEAFTILILWSVQLFDPVIDPWLAHQWPNLPHFFAPSTHTPNPHPAFVREWITILYFLLTPLVVFRPKPSERFAAITGFRKVVLRRKAASAGE